jgi:Putative abortive phage resistance protein AbiGi, antitoxin
MSSRGLVGLDAYGALDSFTVRGDENQLRKIEVMQHARICFTVIPFDLLATHGSAYGRYGIGFTRETVVGWGGCPAWYLPNHHGGDSLKDNGPIMVNGLHAAKIALDSFYALIAETEKCFENGTLRKRFFTQQFTHGKSLVGADLTKWIAHGRNTIDRALSFIKEMSPPDDEDFRYLYEREWRIVEGLAISGKDPCRILRDNEKMELCSQNKNWKNPPSVNDINIQVRHPTAPIIDSFRIFNGALMNERISQKIVMVLVPTEDEKRFVEKLIGKSPKAFKAGGPEVRVFPD